MNYRQTCQKANEVIETVLKSSDGVSLAALTLTIRRAFGLGHTFVKRAVQDLEACGFVKVDNTIIVWQHNGKED